MIEKAHQEEKKLRTKINKLLSKKESTRCCYPGCNLKSIGSHSVSKSTLKIIQEEGHVISPIFAIENIGNVNQFLKQKWVNVKFEPVGIGKASVFKGFCEEHDRMIFRDVDTRGIITQRDLFAQLYRAASKFTFMNTLIDKAESDVCSEKYHSDIEFENSLNISNIKLLGLFHDLLTDFPELDQEIPKHIDGETVILRPYSKSISITPVVIYKKINREYPVYLQKNFILSMDGIYSRSIVIVMPSYKSTHIIITCDESISDQYLSSITSDIKILNFIESVLMSDAEFYISPSIVNAWSTEKKKTIEMDFYFFNERRFLDEYDLSIFDGIRKNICNPSDKYYSTEMEKINKKITRPTIESRHEKLFNFELRSHSKKKILSSSIFK